MKQSALRVRRAAPPTSMARGQAGLADCSRLIIKQLYRDTFCLDISVAAEFVVDSYQGQGFLSHLSCLDPLKLKCPLICFAPSSV